MCIEENWELYLSCDRIKRRRKANVHRGPLATQTSQAVDAQNARIYMKWRCVRSNGAHSHRRATGCPNRPKQRPRKMRRAKPGSEHYKLTSRNPRGQSSSGGFVNGTRRVPPKLRSTMKEGAGNSLATRQPRRSAAKNGAFQKSAHAVLRYGANVGTLRAESSKHRVRVRSRVRTPSADFAWNAGLAFCFVFPSYLAYLIQWRLRRIADKVVCT